MLNKLKFNNLVISNKKGIQQSRIQTINKLVQKIRKLKILMEKHPDNAKCRERIRKSTETMEFLKKLKRMDIMKKVLLMDKPAPAVITNGLSTPEDVAVALLCMNKVMQGLIKRFKTELQLYETKNDKWKQVLMESSKRRQKIERTEEKRRTRLEMKQQKAMGRKRQEWLEENQQEIEGLKISNDKEINISTTGVWQIEELSNENAAKCLDEKIQEKSDKQLKKSVKHEPLTKKTSQTNIKHNPFTKNVEESTDLVKDKVYEEESESSDEIEGIKKQKHKTGQPNETSSDTKEELEEDMIVDPFFITDTGENYLSTAVIKKDHNGKNENNEVKMDLHMIKINSYDRKPADFIERRQQSRYKTQKKDFAHNKQQNNSRWNSREGRDQQSMWNNKQMLGRDKFSQNKWNDKPNHKMGEKNVNHKSAETNDGQNLHPSWVAKQKLKPIIKGFQGKKIIFGDDNSCSEIPQQIQNRPDKPVTSKSYQSEQDSLHPSWVAKQKLKPTITAFQGKKITFDYDD